MPSTTLLLIDAQKDFHPGGSLAIPTANEDANRIAQFIRNKCHDIDRIVATLDSHHKLHIANPCFWYSGDGSGKHPDPFTIISATDLENGVWKPRDDLKLSVNDTIDPTVFGSIEKVQNEDGSFSIGKYCVEYASRLEAKGRFQICIWPEHCLIGTVGHTVVDVVSEAIDYWSEQTGGSVEWILKGNNLLTEMYSALEADVPITEKTSFNEQLFNSLLQCEQLIVCGQAMSHCVNYTLRDITSKWPENQFSKIVLIQDGASAVPGFEDAAKEFMAEMKNLGVTIKSFDSL